MKKTLVLVLLFLSPLSAARGMTLGEAIKIGLENNYTIRMARNSADIAANNRAKGTASFLPSLDVSGNVQRSRSEEETNSPFSFGDSRARGWGGQVSLNWTVFDGFRMFADKKRYDELARLGEYQAREIIENAVVGISRAYFNLVRQEQLLDVARDSRDISEMRLKKERVRNELGGASSTDFLNAQVSFNNDQAALLTQQLQVTIAREELNLLLGRDPSTPVTVINEITIPPLESELAQIQKRAAEKNSSLLVARQDENIADQNVKLARSPFLPRLSLQSTYGYTDRTVAGDAERFTEDINTRSTDAGLGLFLTFNIFNGSRDRADYRNARLEARNRELALRDEENRVAGTIRQAYNTFQQQMQLVELEEQNVIAAQQFLDLQQDRFQLGATTSLEFRDAQVSFIRAQTALISARFQARITRLEIQQLMGNLEIG